MTPIERLTPEQLAERYPGRAELRRAYEQWVTDGRPGDKLPPSLKQLFRWPDPLVVSPQLYADIQLEVAAYQRRQARKRWQVDCAHVGPVPMPNRAERRAAAARKRRAK